MKEIQINTARYPEDVEVIQTVLETYGYKASLKDCEELWGKYSDSMAACWMSLLDTSEQIFNCISGYIRN